MAFQKATKKQAKLRLALIGPSGSGKTYTALTLATHLVPGGRVALIDTERGSAAKYADLFNFDVQELDSCHPQRYIEAIHEAQAAGYDILIIDSLSHAWMGRDGALELVDRAAKRNPSGNSFAAWRDVTPLHNALVDAMLAAKLHLIVTMRSKQEWIMDKDERGKTVVRKVGLQPVQRDGVEYEFDVAGDLDQENTLIITKTRCSALHNAVISKPNHELAEILAAWLDGEPMSDLPEPPPPPTTKGNGTGRPAVIKSGNWVTATKELAERCPYFVRPNGQPDFSHMATMAGQSGYAEVTDSNLADVITALEQLAALVTAAA